MCLVPPRPSRATPGSCIGLSQLEYFPRLSGRLCPRFVLASVAQLEYISRLSGRLCPRFVLASVAQLEYLPRLSGRLCPRFVLASVVQLEYVPHVSQSVSLSSQVHVRVYAYICVNIVYSFTLSFHISLPSIPIISQSVSGPSWHAREADTTQVRNHRRPVAYTQGATAPCRC